MFPPGRLQFSIARDTAALVVWCGHPIANGLRTPRLTCRGQLISTSLRQLVKRRNHINSRLTLIAMAIRCLVRTGENYSFKESSLEAEMRPTLLRFTQ